PDPPPGGHRRAGRGERDDVAGLHVERAAPHVSFTPVAGIDVDAVDLCRVRVPFGAHDTRRDDTIDRAAHVEDVVHREAEIGHVRRDQFDVVAECSQFVEPRVNDLHQNCSTKRRSLLYMSRTSPIACRSLAMRSIPKPNANPLHSSGSRPPARRTLGCTIPDPPSSSHSPDGVWMSNSAEGSVNGK